MLGGVVGSDASLSCWLGTRLKGAYCFLRDFLPTALVDFLRPLPSTTHVSAEDDELLPERIMPPSSTSTPALHEDADPSQIRSVLHQQSSSRERHAAAAATATAPSRRLRPGL